MRRHGAAELSIRLPSTRNNELLNSVAMFIIHWLGGLECAVLHQFLPGDPLPSMICLLFVRTVTAIIPASLSRCLFLSLARNDAPVCLDS